MGYAPQVSGDGTETPAWYMQSNNVIRFRIRGKVASWSIIHTTSIIRRHCRSVWRSSTTLPAALPIPIPWNHDRPFEPEEWEAHAQDIKAFNQTDDTDRLILYPDVEYIAILQAHGPWLWTEDGTLVYSTDRIDDNFAFATPAQDYQNLRLTYATEAEREWSTKPATPRSQFGAGRMCRMILPTSRISGRTSTSSSTPTASSPPTTSAPSRPFTLAAPRSARAGPSPRRSSEKVCVISEQVAENQQWKVGDKLNMQLFESDYIPNAPFVPKQPISYSPSLTNGVSCAS